MCCVNIWPYLFSIVFVANRFGKSIHCPPIMESPHCCHRLTSLFMETYVKINIRITLLMSPFCLWTCGICVNVDIRPLAILKKNLLRPSDKLLWSTITFVMARSALVFGSAAFPNCPKAGSVANLWWSHPAVRPRCMKIPSQDKVTIKPTNVRHVMIDNIVRFSGLGLSQTEKSRTAIASQDTI